MPRDIDRHGVQRLQAEGSAQLVEVLPRDEYAREHIAGALSLPLAELDRARASRDLDHERTIVVYCHDAA